MTKLQYMPTLVALAKSGGPLAPKFAVALAEKLGRVR